MLINAVHQMYDTTAPNERSFASELNAAFNWYVNKNGAHNYAINSILYLKTLREIYVKNLKNL